MLGGGVIGVEFASVWKSFGADVTILEALPRLVAAEDEDISKALERAFRKRKINFKVGKPFEKVEHTENGVKATIQGGETVEAELLLVAVGRGPTTADLGYEEQGVTLDRGFVITDERLHTSVGNIYAVGDIVPGLQLAHRGFQQGIFVAEEIAGRNPAVIDEAGIPRVTYSDPEVASVGLTEAKAKEQYGADKVETYNYNLGGNGKSQILKTQGFVKLVRVNGRPGRRRAHGRRPDGRAGRRGAADLQLGGVPGGGRAAHPRPPDPERGARRGAPGAGRQAAARARLIRSDPHGSPRIRSSRECRYRSPCRGSARASPRAPSPAGSSRRASAVEADEPLLEVSTDKVDTEIPSPAAGVLSRIVVGEDETAEVGSELAVIAGDGEDAGARPQRRPPSRRPRPQAGARAGGRAGRRADEPSTEKPVEEEAPAAADRGLRRRPPSAAARAPR